VRLETLKQVGREAKGNSASVTLVAASVFAAFAAITDIPTWVTIIAAAAAVLSGSQVLWAQLVVPLRIRSAENSSQLIIGRNERHGTGPPVTRGTAFQIAPNRWLTAHHVIHDSVEVVLKLGNDTIPATVLYANQRDDVAVLSAAPSWQWTASITDESPNSGDRIRVVGWTDSGPLGESSIRLAFDYVVQGPAENNRIALSGPDHPQVGFSGAPAIDIRSGRVVGFLTEFRRQKTTQWLPEPVGLAIITLVSSVPGELRNSRASARASSSGPR
jgi:hypothetical protein